MRVEAGQVWRWKQGGTDPVRVTAVKGGRVVYVDPMQWEESLPVADFVDGFQLVWAAAREADPVSAGQPCRGR